MSIKFDWKKTLGTVAPVLASALGGPMAGVAVQIAGGALGITGASEQQIAEAVATGEPSVLVALREAENNFKIEMKRLDVDIERINAGDRDSARDMAKSKGLLIHGVLAAVFILGFVFTLREIFAGTVIVEEMRAPAMYVLGILSAGVMQIMNFFFGSSSGSKEKTALMGTK
jgi:hypothetical protein